MRKILATLIVLSLFVASAIQAQVELDITPVNTTVLSGNNFTVDVTVQNFTDVRGMQFSINWDTAILDYVSHGNVTTNLPGLSGAIGIVNTPNGKFTTAWFNGGGVGLNLPNNEVLFSIDFLAKATPCLSDSILFTGDPTAILFRDTDLDEIPYDLSGGNVDIQCTGTFISDVDFTSPLCLGDSSGSIDITVIGGTAPYNFTWSNAANSEDLFGIPAGTYTVTVTDQIGSSAVSDPIILSDPTSPISIISGFITNETSALNDGQIIALVAGGTAPLIYNWSNGDDTQIITGLSADMYSLTVTDANGCTATDVFTVEGPGSVLNVPYVVTNVLCANQLNGAINISPSGGVQPYTYIWSNGAMTEDLVSIPAGVYSVTVTDAMSTIGIASGIVVSQPAPINISATVISENGVGGNGSINITVTGGTAPYEYLWSAGTSTEDISGLPSGNYNVVIFDVNDCIATDTFTVFPLLDVDVLIGNVNCHGGSTGFVDIQASGGTPPLSYLWNNNAITEDLINVQADSYFVTITDGAGIPSIKGPFVVSQPLDLFVFDSTIINETGALNDGSIDITPLGGTAPYSYVWSNAATTEDITGLSAGTYTVTITDSLGCIEIDAFNILFDGAVPLELEYETIETCFGDSTGSIDITVSGGVPPYGYIWSNGATTEDVFGLSAGVYFVTVSDTQGGTVSEGPIVLNQLSAIQVIVDNVNDETVALNDGSVDVSIVGSIPPYTFAWSNTAITEDISSLSAGSYVLTVTDDNGCVSVSDTIVVNFTFPPIDVDVSVSDIDCFGNSTGAINISVSGGDLPYTYLWSNAATTEDLIGVPVGNYTVTITDNVGTEFIEGPITITQPAQAISITNIIGNVVCNGDSTGSVSITPSGGTAPYTYLWNNADTTEDLTNLFAGTYEVTITDSLGCIFVPNPFTVNEPNQLSIDTFFVTDVACFGESTGAIDLVVSGGVPNYSYVWSNLAVSQDLNNIPAGNYSVKVTDNNNCTAFSPIIVVDQPSDSLSLSLNEITHIACNGDSAGGIDINIGGGAAPYTFTWSNAATTEDLTNVVGGIYGLTITDDNGCQKTNSYTIEENTAIVINAITVTNPDCGIANGSIDITVSGGTAPYVFAWSNTDVTEDISGLGAGNYTVIITDSLNCTITSTVIVLTESEGVSIDTAIVSNVNCFGDSTGNINLEVSGGTAPYTFIWSNADSTEDITGLLAGQYQVTVSDATGCEDILTGITVGQPLAPLSITLSQITTESAVLNDGAIDITISGGTAPYTFVWNNTATTEDLNGLSQGSYQVVVTDSLGCTITSDTFEVGFSANPVVITVDQVEEVACFGDSTGSISISVTGGVAPYTYLWSNGDIAEDITGLSANVYAVTVTDQTNVFIIESNIIVGQPTNSIAIGLDNLGNVLCAGDSTGGVSISVTGGTAPYAFAWSNGTTMEDLSGVPAGVYQVNVLDSNLCSSTSEFTITAPNPISYTLDSIKHSSCFEGANGAIYITAQGGNEPYDFDWGTETNEDITGLSAGSYTVTITDANDCVFVSNGITITAPDSISIVLTNTVDVNCAGDSTGLLEVSATGGTPAYTYTWSNGDTGPIANQLTSGSYIVTVSDLNGCTNTAFYIVNELSGLSVSVDSVTNVLCNGDLTGTIEITISGGTAPYGYAWSDGSTTEDLFSISAGTYTPTITDNTGCMTVGNTITISEPDVIEISNVIIGNETAATNDGSIDITVTGGVTPYAFAWSNVATIEDVSGLTAGQYVVTITDANDCVFVSDSILVTSSSLPIIIDSVLTTDVLCFGDSTGAIDLFISGGTGIFTYSWVTGQSTQDLNGIPAGDYMITISDNLGNNTSSSIITIDEPLSAVSVTLDSSSNVSCNGAMTGSINITPAGGTGPYTFVWTGGYITEDIGGIPAGDYTVTITDDNGCSTTFGPTTISEPAATVSATLDASTDVLCNGDSTGSISITAVGGTGPYAFAWTGGYITEDISGIPAGDYTVTITDDNGCSTTFGPTTISEPAVPVSVTLDSSSNVSCNGGSDGSIGITPTGGVGPYTFIWTGGYVTEDINDIPADNYMVTVTDDNGCSTVFGPTIITEPAAPVSVTLDSNSNVSCNGAMTGSISIIPTGGTGPYTFAWDGGYVTEDISGVPAGDYNVTVTDDNGCSTIFGPTTITEPAATISVTLDDTINVLCNGDSTGAISITPVGGTGPYTFAWDGGYVTEDISGVPAGDYTVTITDDNGCSTIFGPTTITQPATPITVALDNVVDVSCNGDSTGGINITPTGGTGPYTFAWTGAYLTEDISGIPAGDYTVTITDDNGCSTTFGPTNVGEAGAITIEVDTIIDVLCFGDSTGEVNINILGGMAPYTFVWNYPSIDEDLTGVPAGNYLVTVTDDNGCTASTFAFTVDQPAAPLTVSLNTTVDVNCPGDETGLIDITPAGGTAPYTYLWSNNNEMTQDIGGLSAGNYTVTITDDNGCSTISSVFTINTLSTPIIIDDVQIEDIFCFGDSTGFIDIDFSGGQGPYTFDWSNGMTTEDISGLPVGIYTVEITDGNECSTTSSPIAINHVNPAITIDDIAIQDVPCFEEFTGGINLTVSGGDGSYTYSWSNGATTEDLDSLAIGAYSVTITDGNGCTLASEVINVIQSDPIIVESEVSLATYFGNDGSIDLTVTGGTLPYVFDWSNGEISEDLVGVTYGTYSVTITDANNCPYVDSFTVDLDRTGCLGYRTIISPNEDGKNDAFVIQCIELYEHDLKIFDRWGKLVFESANYDNDWVGTDMDGNLLRQGGYLFVLMAKDDSSTEEVIKGTITIVRE